MATSNFQTRKNLFTLLHIVAWIIVLILPLYFFNTEWARNTSFINRYYVSAIIYGLVFYINYFFLVPRLFLESKKIYYFLSITALIVCLFYVESYVTRVIFSEAPIEHQFRELIRKFNEENNLQSPPFGQMHLINFVITNILISGFSIGLRISEKFVQQEKQQKELEKVKLTTELALLKNQVSPHFFFNTLNNIYSLIELKSADAQKAVLQLSKLMRYLLYESEQGEVKLSQELEFMNNYVDLMKLRLNSKFDLQVSFPGDSKDIIIPPLLFVPFVENAFKHGISYQDKSFIHISLEIEQDSLIFKCINSIAQNGDNKENNFSGIGLENIRKRLSLLFPERHELNINTKESVFEVFLKIKNTPKSI